MPRNSGNTHLKRRRRANDPMREFDRLPTELRQWMSSAMLPWGASSVRRAYAKAMRETGNTTLALKELDALQSRLVCRDAKSVWGDTHPTSQGNQGFRKP